MKLYDASDCVHYRRASDNTTDSSQTDSDSCNSPQINRANKLMATKSVIPKFAISSEEDKGLLELCFSSYSIF